MSTLGTLWASNRRHLDQLRCYVAATVRDEPPAGRGECCGLEPAAWYAGLPGWVKAAKTRTRVLKGISRLTAIADRSGLD
ncbi:MAG: hypothetical protein FWF02_14840 [Micrococcales bacterium]|nr:hypothetical protein [Micrococcales bacterium]MCL2668955.1 hypothetical protein [Micrococcales bacterium]